MGPGSPPPADGVQVLTPDSAGTRDDVRLAAHRMLGLGLWAWPAFIPLDLFMTLVQFPKAPLGLFLLYRLVGEAALLGSFVATRRPGTSAATASRWVVFAFCALAALISLMALELGGIVSPYVHGLSVVILVQLTMLPGLFWSSVARAAPVALAFPAVMAGAALVEPERGAAYFTGPALAEFASHFVFVIGILVVGSAASHAAWAAREQVYRARRLGRYRLQAPLGKGGMGEVWLGWDTALKRNVALKLLRQQGAPSPGAVRLFEREARAAAALASPHTIRIFDFGVSDDGIHFIAMEYLAGLDLQALVERRGPLPPMRAVALLLQACDALVEAHAAGVVHRDIKPPNLFLTCVDEGDFLKVLDFGIAHMRELEQRTTRSVGGTPGYTAPEIWLGARADPAQDVYGMGATLHYVLTGTPHVLGEGVETAPAAPRSLRAEQPGPPRALPPAVEPVVRRCLAADPANRYRDARELRDALSAVFEPAGWTAADARAFWGSSPLLTGSVARADPA